MKEYKIDVELHQVGDYKKNDYRLFVNGSMMVERPWNLPSGYSHQVVHLTCNLDKGENRVWLENLGGHLQVAKININGEEIQHNTGIFNMPDYGIFTL